MLWKQVLPVSIAAPNDLVDQCHGLNLKNLSSIAFC